IIATEYSVATFAAEHACPWGGLDGFEILEAPPEVQRQDFRPIAHEYAPGRQPRLGEGKRNTPGAGILTRRSSAPGVVGVGLIRRSAHEDLLLLARCRSCDLGIGCGRRRRRGSRSRRGVRRPVGFGLARQLMKA